MTLAETFEELERGLPADKNGSIEQRIHFESKINVFAKASTSDPSRSIEIRVRPGVLDAYNLPDGTKGIDVEFLPKGHQPTVLAIRLMDATAADLFTPVAADVAKVAAAADEDVLAVEVVINRFARWHKLLQRGARGLSSTSQRGLFAELAVLQDILAPAVGGPSAVAAWQGPEGAPRDFDVDGIGVEVKSSIANEPQVATINGERQLDDSGLVGLFLVHVSLEPVLGGGVTLPAAVSATRELVAQGPGAIRLDDMLIEAGYLDEHAPMYKTPGYVVRDKTIMRVVPGFPRLIEDDLPPGVGGVRYSLAVDACTDHRVSQDQLTAHLGGAHDV